LPLAGLYWLLLGLRRLLYRLGVLSSYRAAVPVIIVGNITAGGTGKTPVAIWLANELKARGFSPGIVSRGYGGNRASASMRVDSASEAAVVGDEPVLIARRTGCPVVVDANRSRAAAMLVEDGVDVIIADDGLQHCLLLPAGPLRETVDRLAEVDQVLVNGSLRDREGSLTAVEQNAIEFRLVASEVQRLNGSLARPIERFEGTTVHGVAAIGNPRRFFEQLRAHGMQVIEHAFPDHAPLRRSDLEFGDKFDILMTEKDAVKFDGRVDDRFWVVPVELAMDPALSGPWLEQIESRLHSDQESE
jgi:tetraacyldisaccharide 4'-kinase